MDVRSRPPAPAQPEESGESKLEAKRKSSPFKIARRDIIYKKDVTDTYVKIGEQINTLAIEEKRREQFYKSHPLTEALLKREAANPLVEEGKYEETSRKRKGEYYLTQEAISLLLNAKLEQYKDRKDFDAKNIYFIDRSARQLYDLLTSLHLQPGEDAKFIVIRGIHALAFYMRNEEGQIKVFIFDSEPGNLEQWEIEQAKCLFGDPLIVSSSTRLQLDYYSCSTFAIDTLVYFATHGAEIFPHIEKTIKAKNGCHVLDKKDLMPGLLKMCQTEMGFELSPETLDTIVTPKKKETLRQYWHKHKQIIDGKLVNTAALKRKYMYADRLEHYLEKILKPKEKIFPSGRKPLPKSIDEASKRLSKPPEKSTFIHFIDQCMQIAHHLHDTPSPLSRPAIALCMRIKSKSEDFVSHAFAHNKKYLEECKSPAATEHYQLYRILYIAALDEFKGRINALSDSFHQNVCKHAEKLLRLFGTCQKAVEYLKKYWPKETLQPLHDACLFDLPAEDTGWDKERWSTLVIRYGKKVTRYLPRAVIIDAQLKDVKPSESDELVFLKNASKQYSYARASEHPTLAVLCNEYQKTEVTYNTCLALANEGKFKTVDLLPSFELRFKKADENSEVSIVLQETKSIASDYSPSKPMPKPDYTFKRLPPSDFTGLFLGEETKCCQSVGSAGEQPTLYGMTSPYAGFYVVTDKYHSIIGQSLAWIGPNGEFVFDSLEYRHLQQTHLWEPILEAAAIKIMQEGFSCVNVGSGGATPNDLWEKSKLVVKPRDYKSVMNDSHKSQLAIHRGTKAPLLERIKQYALAQKFETSLTEAKTTEDAIRLLSEEKSLNQESAFKLILFCYRNGYHLLHELTNHYDLTDLSRLIQSLGEQLNVFMTVPNSLQKTLFNIIQEQHLYGLLLQIICVFSLQKPGPLTDEQLACYFKYINDTTGDKTNFTSIVNDYRLLIQIQQFIENKTWEKHPRPGLFGTTPGKIIQVRELLAHFPETFLHQTDLTSIRLCLKFLRENIGKLIPIERLTLSYRDALLSQSSMHCRH